MDEPATGRIGETESLQKFPAFKQTPLLKLRQSGDDFTQNKNARKKKNLTNSGTE
jgi:hypothetical protein